MKTKYRALRFVMTLYRIFAALTLVGGIISGVLLIMDDFAVNGIGAILGGIIGAITLLAVAQLIQVLLDMEENTRRTTEIQMRLYKLQKERL